MKIIIGNVPKLDDDEQMVLGRELMKALFYQGVDTSGVTIATEDD